MIPFILAGLGGYLLGDAMKDKQIFADGGEMTDLQKSIKYFKDVDEYMQKEILTQEERDTINRAFPDWVKGNLKYNEIDKNYINTHEDDYSDDVKFADGGNVGTDLVGKRIRLIEMKNEKYPVEPGTMGTIMHYGAGVINVKWDNGRYLGVIDDLDKFEIIEKKDNGGNVDDAFFNRVVKIMKKPISLQEQLLTILMIIESSLNDSSWLYIDNDYQEYFNIKMFKDYKKGIDYALSEAKIEMGEDYYKDKVVDVLDDFSTDLGMYIVESEDFKESKNIELNKLEREIKTSWPSMVSAYLEQIKKAKN